MNKRGKELWHPATGSGGSGRTGGRGAGGAVGRGGAAERSSEDGHEFIHLAGVAVRAENFPFFGKGEEEDFKDLPALFAAEFINRHKTVSWIHRVRTA